MLVDLVIKGMVDVKPLPWGKLFEPVNHEAQARELAMKKAKVESVIIRVDHLKDELCDNPSYAHTEHNLGSSRFEERLRACALNRYYTHEEVEAIEKKYGFPKQKFNYKPADDRESMDFISKLHDEIYSVCHNKYIPEVIECLKADCEYLLDADFEAVERKNGNLVKATKKQREEQFPRYLEHMMMPRILTHWERLYQMPEPFNHWDSRNREQQFFLVKYPNQPAVHHIWGGSGSSGTRENKGRWAHICATLEDGYSYTIPTHMYVYTDTNEFKFLSRYENFKTTCMELTGNYQADHKAAHALFHDMNRIIPTMWEDELK